MRQVKTLLGAVLALLTGQLLMDLTQFAAVVDWSASAPADSGVGLAVFDGALQIAEYIPYNQTPAYFIGFCAVLVGMFLLAVALMRQPGNNK